MNMVNSKDMIYSSTILKGMVKTKNDLLALKTIRKHSGG